LLTRAELEETEIPHRAKMRKAIVEGWQCEYKRLKQEMQVSSHVHTGMGFSIEYASRQHIAQNSLGKISFTADIWSDPQLRPFLAITAHWIQHLDNGTLALRADLVAFS
jgi:hypothetical protein